MIHDICWTMHTQALHFYLNANEKRCFLEELPSETIVEGKSSPLICSLVTHNPVKRLLVMAKGVPHHHGSLTYPSDPPGHYKALEWVEDEKDWKINNDMGIQVTVEASVFLLLPRGKPPR
jgi:hypothetical protein